MHNDAIEIALSKSNKPISMKHNHAPIAVVHKSQKASVEKLLNTSLLKHWLQLKKTVSKNIEFH